MLRDIAMHIFINVMFVCVSPMLVVLFDGITMLVFLECFFSYYRLRALTHVYPYCVITHLLHLFHHFVKGS